MAQLFLVLVASVYVALSHGSPTFEHRHAVYGKVLCHNEYSAWKSYQARTDRIVSTASKEARLAAFLANLKMIQEHNEAYERGETSFKMGLHSRSDWPQWEMALLNGLKPSDPSAQQDTRPFTPPKNADVPKSIDWRSRGAVTGVKDQGYNGSACGACWAFGTVGAVEAAHFIKTGKLVSLSVQNLVDCATPAQGYPGESGCGGSNTTSEPFKYVVDHGLESEDDYPYREIPKQIEEACQFNKNKVAAKISSYEQVKQGDEEQLKIAVGTRGPVSVAIQTTDKWQSYTEGIFDDNTCTAGASNHIVLVVGYGTTDDGKDYWIVKNSYGLYWGDGGYIKMARNHNNICGIADDAVVPVV